MSSAFVMVVTAYLLVAQEAAPVPPPEPPPNVAPPPTANPETANRPRAESGMGLVSGRVAVAGEGAVPSQALVQVTCPGGFTRSQLTRDRFDLAVIPDATQEAGQPVACTLTVSLSGYNAISHAVYPRGQTQLGLVLLKPRPGINGFSYSATSLMAPPKARQAFEQGNALAQKKKMKDAMAAWENAVALHPKYAAAWLELGIARQADKRAAEAQEAFHRALEADPKFLPPLLHLAALAAGERNWKLSADLSDRLIALNPVEFPEAYLYNAAAFYNLGHRGPAEQAVRSAISLDPKHQYPKSHQLLGVILAERQDVAGAIEQFQMFLRHAPKSPDAPMVRARLAELEKLR